MQEIYKFFIGIFILLLGIPIGNILAKITKEELKKGRRWFNAIIILSFLGAIISLLIENDVLLFTFLFIAIITSRCLKK